ncbi:MAG TPA: hypothetical protein VK203_04595 [Nostocaceae cyanobacterium]|nr:hypothetical protein [Nostocaceae cyanobacterium]
MVNNINLIFVGWVEQSETQHFQTFVGLRNETQPTINLVLHKENGRAEKVLNLPFPFFISRYNDFDQEFTVSTVIV